MLINKIDLFSVNYWTARTHLPNTKSYVLNSFFRFSLMIHLVLFCMVYTTICKEFNWIQFRLVWNIHNLLVCYRYLIFFFIISFGLIQVKLSAKSNTKQYKQKKKTESTASGRNRKRRKIIENRIYLDKIIT